MTWLGTLNYFVQFFFVRVCKDMKDGKVIRWGILYPVLPFTGWITPYTILNKSNKLKFKWFK